jgi:membrane-associated phospholipid phosphatase
MLVITGIGSVSAYMILLPLVYWCVDEKKGCRLALAVMFSAWVNLSLKFLLDQPRPFFTDFDPILGLTGERFGGFPSGHAQNSLVMWFIAAAWLKKKRFYVIAALICLLVGFSRVYLGVHFPTDVAGGWIIGGLILWAYFFLEPRLTKFFERGGLRMQLVACAAAAFVMILYRPADEALMPAAALFGTGAGFSLNRGFIGFRARDNSGGSGGLWFSRLGGRLLTGGAGIFLILLVFQKLLAGPAPESGSGIPAILSSNYRVFYFLRFALIGLWGFAGAPLLFLKLEARCKGFTREAQQTAGHGGKSAAEAEEPPQEE